jgi:DNA repair photolyase
VPSVDEDAWSRLEPGTASPRQRIRAVRQMSDAGIETGVLMMPLVPGITTTRASIEKTLRALADAGVRQVGANVARFDPGVKEHFFAFLEREYPHLIEGYRRLYPKAYVSKEYAQKVKATVADFKGALSL